MEQQTRRPPSLLSKVRVGEDLVRLFRESVTNRAIFRYTWGPDAALEFDMLCEVSQHFIPIYRRMISRLGLKIVHFEDDEDCYDTLVRR